MTATERPVRSYRPGDWFGIFGRARGRVLPPTEKARVAALWELVDGGAGFDETLDALISGGLRDLPGFVLVSTGEGETRVVLRGAARADFTSRRRDRRARGLRRHHLGRAVAARRRADEHRAPRGPPRPTSRRRTSSTAACSAISRLDEAPAHDGARRARRRSRPTSASSRSPADGRRTTRRPRLRRTRADPDPARSPEPPDGPRAARPPIPPVPPVLPPVAGLAAHRARCPRRSSHRRETDHDGLTDRRLASRRRGAARHPGPAAGPRRHRARWPGWCSPAARSSRSTGRS